MFFRQLKEDILFYKAVLRRFERLIGNNNERIIVLEERIELYEERERCKCEHKEIQNSK